VPIRDPVRIRIDSRTKAALEQAAVAYDRRASALAREIVIRWLWANGWLHNETANAAPSGPSRRVDAKEVWVQAPD
jgi:hypothetical protein